MTHYNKSTVLSALDELGSLEAQNRLWLSDGSSGEISSFEEAICQIFDAGVTHELETRQVPAPSYLLFIKLDHLISKVPENMPPKDLISLSIMTEIRDLAVKLKNSITK
ncbi:hypothetical protein KIH39_15550 [Telmatocola sphagniphila]|uniref:Uncharacterized protein n=1 Tax=Telmatocola sphagniphila TaxID=1123043 RepID=A0A8E6B1R8_9BACT|nr:hypothetical protein [Telmatocola sphagniphila]QVL30268.1 hypothetical protein KIH39_15550 [Telmatocola sphagniphila]